MANAKVFVKKIVINVTMKNSVKHVKKIII